MKTFPILHTRESIPWEAIEPHREQAKRNHCQTLERLAERGGLTWREAYFVLSDSPCPSAKCEDVDYRRLVLDLVEATP